MPEFVKLMVKGPTDLWRGFVTGWGAGQGWLAVDFSQRVIWPEDWDIEVETMLEGIVDAVMPGSHTFVLVREDTADALLAALAPWQEELGFQVRSRRRVLRASFAFKFAIFDREEAREVRRIFDELPEGVQISGDYAPTEHSHDDGSGVYAPVHSFECHASGTVGGPLRDVLGVHARALAHERIDTKPVRLELEEPRN